MYFLCYYGNTQNICWCFQKSLFNRIEFNQFILRFTCTNFFNFEDSKMRNIIIFR